MFGAYYSSFIAYMHKLVYKLMYISKNVDWLKIYYGKQQQFSNSNIKICISITPVFYYLHMFYAYQNIKCRGKRRRDFTCKINEVDSNCMYTYLSELFS